MDHFSNKPSTDFSNDQDNSINDESSSQTDASEVQADILVSAEVSIPTSPIPLVHISNSFDDSKEAGPSNLLKAEDDYYKMLLEDCAKDYVYFDFTSQSVKEMNESDDNGYDGYSEYNEYGERYRCYYCRDGRYERKSSQMMSPIISPVTA